tara:strand:- start:1401 stop:1601 length:201 start_codon:yes stop_codon:yes gene_type:complete
MINNQNYIIMTKINLFILIVFALFSINLQGQNKQEKKEKEKKEKTYDEIIDKKAKSRISLLLDLDE